MQAILEFIKNFHAELADFFKNQPEKEPGILDDPANVIEIGKSSNSENKKH